MQFSLPFIDIIIFAIIAIFLIFRLKNILGEKTGFDPSEDEKKINPRQTAISNVVELSKQNKKVFNSIDQKIIELQKLDNSFVKNDFLSGAKIFFDMVIKSFVKGDLNNINKYVKSNLLKDFQVAISERIKDEESLIINIKKIQKTIIKDIEIYKSNVKIQVLFETQQIKALKDKNNKIIDGDLDKIITVKDLWKFEKDINSNDKNWTLIETTID